MANNASDADQPSPDFDELTARSSRTHRTMWGRLPDDLKHDQATGGSALQLTTVAVPTASSEAEPRGPLCSASHLCFSSFEVQHQRASSLFRPPAEAVTGGLPSNHRNLPTLVSVCLSQSDIQPPQRPELLEACRRVLHRIRMSTNPLWRQSGQLPAPRLGSEPQIDTEIPSMLFALASVGNGPRSNG